MLKKVVDYVYTPGTAGTPGNPGRPAIPAWDQVIYLTPEQALLAQGFQFVAGSTLGFGGGETFFGSGGGSQGLGGPVKPKEPDPIIVHHPAEPAIPPTPPIPSTPASWRARQHIGWNAGAYSKSVLDGDLETVFKVPGPATGVIVALTPSPSPKRKIQQLQYGLYFVTGVCRVWELGVIQPGSQTGYVTGDTWKIQRLSGKVRYLKNNVVVYESTKRSVGPLIVEAVLYGTGDSVD